ncbi:MAG: BLUF domain-containing protein, partial [Burkholderiaceae bacterium]|nr:BLUF domain-containing protein [Burkholderiaceae bacterium]
MQNDEGQTVKSLHNIVYCSRAAHGVDKEALEKIIATARHHNPRFGITGLLVFGSGVFFQWLEGPKDNVTSLFKMISADARHSDVVLLTQEDEFRERLFPNWDMELV